MIPKECKRLAEVDFPIAVVSAHSAREKSIRHGHPSTLHLWWARRPLAACRAMLLALLLPDPCDPNCPAEFKDDARELLNKVQGKPGPKDLDLRKAILKFIGDFSNWDLAANARYLEVGRGLVKAAHGEEAPLVVDPFAGGGSIPLEALRLGCEAFASDLNPVACLILKVMLEDIPRYGPKLAEELRRVGAEIKKQAEKELAQYYPPDPDGAIPIAYLWARTVQCEAPGCGAEIPLLRSFWLSKRATRRLALRPNVLRPIGGPPLVELEIFAPTSESEVLPGTVRLANAKCLACNVVLPKQRVRAQLLPRFGGGEDARLLAVLTTHLSADGRAYRLPTQRDLQAVRDAQARAAGLLDRFPGEEIPTRHKRNSGFGVKLYGMKLWRDLFTPRQRLALATLVRLAHGYVGEDLPVREVLALSISRCAEQMSSLVRWRTTVEAVAGTFGRQALPMMWDFTEIVPAGSQGSNFEAAVQWVAEVIEAPGRAADHCGQVQVADACESPLPDDSASVWFTDPPYYDAIAYADLSDFFFVWLKRALPGHPLLRDPFDPENQLTPKSAECIVNEERTVDGMLMGKVFFETRITRAFGEGRRVTQDDGVAAIVFAHKTTEGWEALLDGVIRAGWVITASWPVATERGGRLLARESAVLATSIHLVCRPRPQDADVGDWGDVLRELPNRIGDWMERLSAEGVRGADLVFACIGPAMEVYSRYRRVEDAEGREIPLGGDPEATEPHKRGFLAYVWEIVGRTALGHVLGTAEARARNGAAGALEEDARLTALFLWTIQSTAANGAAEEGSSLDAAEADSDDEDEEASSAGSKKGLTLIYDVVRRFSQPLGIHLDTWNERIIETKKGIVRLLPVKERAEHLLGEDGASGVADVIERSRGGPINYQFGFMDADKRAPKPARDGRKRGKATPDEAPTVAAGTTTLDRVHIAMLLQASGKSNALRTMLKAETDRGPDFLRLANALSALYPKDSEEKRLLDAMLLAMPR